MKTYDVIIIGAGTAGLAARAEVARKTDDYLVIDNGPLGTTCARTGCMPSKALLEIAADFHGRHRFLQEGIIGSEFLKASIPAVLERVRELRDHYVGHVKSDMEEWRSTHLIRKTARFTEPNVIDLGDRCAKGRRIIIATGSKPMLPGPWRDVDVRVLTTDSFFDRTDLPLNVVVLGLGPIGLEISQALARLGLHVQACDPNRAPGGLTDPEVIARAEEIFSEEWEIAWSEATPLQTDDLGLHARVGDQTWVTDLCLAAMGRKPNLSNLNLEALGLELDENGIPPFDPNTLQVEGMPIFIVGDANGLRPVLHEANDEGRIAGYNAVADRPERFQRRLPLLVTFTDPCIAIVGTSHAELKRSARAFEIGQADYRGQGRAHMTGSDRGLVRIYGDSATGELLGAEILAPAGEHLAHLLAWILSLNLTAEEALSLPFYHPVVEEGLRTALRELTRKTRRHATAQELMRCDDPAANSAAS